MFQYFFNLFHIFYWFMYYYANGNWKNRYH